MATNYSVKVDLADLVYLRPGAARVALLDLFRKHEGRMVEVAEVLGVHHATLKRWVVKLGIRDRIEAVRARRGLKPAQTPARAKRGQYKPPTEVTAS